MQIVELKVNVEKSQLEALAAEVNKLNGKVINFKTSTTGAGAATAGMQKGFNQTAAAADKAGQSILGVVGKVAKWTAVTTAVYAPIKAFKEAVSTIKALDTEMVNVQKVTGASARQMQQFQDRAYQLSTQYGRSVTDVAAAMTSFARAGYGDKLDEMAELSTLVQNVGYVSEDTADSMLLAVDAAWKLNGSHTELMKVIDGVDKVTNQNATDFQKMAEGMTVAASVFAESGESIQTFAAMVGTGTAATQRGGSEIARGLRTIMMNIRQIKGETEDGELIDGESIAKASAALKEFAGISTMENGELRKASDVLADLAHKWDELDTVQQSAISEALAGKRQANILTALMGNWDMVEKQMKEYADAAGTAFKENDIYMDSWAAKTEQLKAKWTDFVANFVTSDLAKGFLDGLIKGVEVLDSGFGQAAIKAGAFALAMNGITKGLMALAGTTVVRDLGAFISLLSTEGVAAFGALSATLTPLMAIAALSADFMFMKKAVDDAYVSMDEQESVVEDLKSQYEQLTGAGSEYAQLMDKVGTGDLTQRDRARLTVLNAQADALERQIKLEEERQFQMFQQQESGRYQRENGQMVDTGVGKTGDVKRLQEMNKLYEEGYEKVKKGESSLEDYRGVLQDIIADNSDWYEQMKEWENLGFGDSFTDAQKEAMALYETIAKLLDLGDEDLPIVKTLDKLEESGMGVTDFANQTVVDAAQIRQAFADAGMGIEETNAAIEALRNSGDIVIDVQNDNGEQTLENLEKLGIAVKDADGWKIDINGLEDLAGKLGLSKTEADNLVKALDGIDGVNFDGVANSVGVIYDSVQSLIASNPTVEINATDNATPVAQQAQSSIDSVDKQHNTDFLGNSTGVSHASSTAKNDIRTVPPSWTTVFSGNTGPIAAAVSRAKALIASLGSGVGPGGGKAGSGSAGLHKATGDLHFKGGPVLLGDELSSDGSPRPELVITKNGAFIAGMAGPVMTSLPAGSRIFKYSDTMDIMSGGDMTQLQAFSLGDDYLRGKNKPQSTTKATSQSTTPSSSNSSKGKSGGTSTKSGGSSSSSNKSAGRSSGTSSGGSSSSGGGGSSVDTLKEELELLEAQYSFLEASNASTEELSDKSKEIQGKLHQINDTLRSTGGKEKDIVDYSTKWWQEQEKIRETTQKVFEDRRELLETELEIMDASGKALDNRTAEREEIEKALRAYQQGGNVNLLKRPVIDASILRDVGWDDAGDGQATVFSSTFSNEDGTLAINFTPIIADKDGNFIDALEPDALWEYAEEVIEGVHDDYLNLQIGAAFTGEDAIEQAEKAAEEIHNLHEKYFLEDIGKEKTLYEAQIESIEAVQDSLHQEAEYLRSIGADQKDINKLSAQWWQELKKIREVQRGIYQNERELLQSQSDLMEHQKKSAGERIAKLREIQDNLHQEAEYMRSIKADQAEINQLSIQWWEVQEQILQIQKDLAESLDATVRARLRQIGDEKDDAIKTIRGQIKEIEKERDSKLKELIEVKYKDLELNRDDLDLEQAKLDAQEKRNKLLEAEQNLRNAMNDRSVRYYNAATGQWEWGADAKKVKQAQEELDRAKKDSESAKKDVRRQEYELEKKRLENDYDKKIQAKEDQIDKLTDEFDDLEKEWERMYDRMFGNDLGNIENILQQMLDTGVITDAQAQEIRAFWNKINGFAESIDLTTKDILGAVRLIQNVDGSLTLETPGGNMYLVPGADVEKLRSGEASNIIYREDNDDGSTSNYDIKIHDDKPVVQESTTTTTKNEGGGTTTKKTIGTTYAAVAAGGGSSTSSSTSTSSSGTSSTSSGSSSSSSSSSSGSSSSGSSVEDIARRNGVDLGVAQSMKETNDRLGYEKYDSGGILNGFGGIKATARDEIVIPPDLAEYMLKPSANKTFQNRVSELAYLYGSKPIPGALSNNRSSNDHYGDTYTFGNVTLTEDKAKNTTVYELAQMSRSLGIYRNG